MQLRRSPADSSDASTQAQITMSRPDFVTWRYVQKSESWRIQSVEDLDSLDFILNIPEERRAVERLTRKLIAGPEER